jgi:phasin family protein
MAQTTTPSLSGDIVKMLEQFKLPGIDVAAIIEARRKDIDAVMTANRVALDGAQALGQKQAEILRKTLEEVRSLVQQATAAGSMTEKSSKAGELVQKALHEALANMRELADTAYKSQTDAFAVVSKRVEANLDELKAMLQPPKK